MPAAAKDRNLIVGCLALLLVAGGLVYLMSDPHAGERREREATLRDACIQEGRAAFRAAHRGAEMDRAQAADLVGRCFSEARRNAN
jgi:hypothetical protein